MTDDTLVADLIEEIARLRQRNEYVEDCYEVLQGELALAKAALQIWENAGARFGFSREEKDKWN